MKNIFNHLWTGGLEDCNRPGGWAVVHACKHPCHKQAVGYASKISDSHEYYFVLETENNLFLNMVDTSVPLFDFSLFEATVQFLDKHSGTPTLIHCNQGISRSRTLALVYLAVKGLIPNGSYDEAVYYYTETDKIKFPYRGIHHFVKQNWTTLIERLS
jgi:protein-tyrosine phosphatase